MVTAITVRSGTDLQTVPRPAVDVGKEAPDSIRIPSGPGEAYILGVYAGFVAVVPRSGSAPAVGPDLAWIARFGFIVGYTFKVFLLLSAGQVAAAAAIAV